MIAVQEFFPAEEFAFIEVSEEEAAPGENVSVSVNGEIYNHLDLKKNGASGACGDYPFQSGSDCEVILALYRKHGPSLVEHLSGMYAFVLYDPKNSTWIVGRDPIGIIPLYYGTDDDGRLWVASEMKALVETCDDIQVFPPGQDCQA